MSEKTDWYPESIKPVRIGLYEIELYFDNSPPHPGFLVWTGEQWRTRDGYQSVFGASGDKWRGLTAEIKRCAAARDGDCSHVGCPQILDNEPKRSGRHCPLDRCEDA